MILELPEVPIRTILLKLSLADFKSIQSVFVSANNINLKQLSNLIYDTIKRRHIETISSSSIWFDEWFQVKAAVEVIYISCSKEFN